MKKKRISVVVLLICCCLLCGCEKKQKQTFMPEEEQIRKICELSTIECHYNNVAKGIQTKGEGILHLGEKDRKYWVEYTGVAKLGIDMSKVSMEIEENNIVIKMPEAEIQFMGYDEDSYNEESVITSEDNFFNKNKITVEKQQEAIAEAQKTMEETILGNKELMSNAQNRAKILIENYINEIGNATGVTYNIEWK